MSKRLENICKTWSRELTAARHQQAYRGRSGRAGRKDRLWLTGVLWKQFRRVVFCHYLFTKMWHIIKLCFRIFKYDSRICRSNPGGRHLTLRESKAKKSWKAQGMDGKDGEWVALLPSSGHDNRVSVLSVLNGNAQCASESALSSGSIVWLLSLVKRDLALYFSHQPLGVTENLW